MKMNEIGPRGSCAMMNIIYTRRKALVLQKHDARNEDCYHGVVFDCGSARCLLPGHGHGQGRVSWLRKDSRSKPMLFLK